MRLNDPDEIAKHVLAAIKPEFSKECQPGDILIAGTRFGHGNPHAQAFKGMYALGIGVAAEWMTRGAYRNCVIAGVPFLPECPGITELCSEGDRIRIDYSTGLFENLTTGASASYQPIPAKLREMIQLGGSGKYWTQKLQTGGTDEWKF
ncbi:hypothetical protein [Bacillus sp. FJAT-50079]|uniref:hypothetical protein n=1 Tax=Bacillus sp. FJAT-50079 TaxID=2833577 RepID=UPI001BC91307|nr:hypothetical protein [Bacillus sp. FJAT-50079]MBS4210581.1 hypothetical protein [Bacillus sp. FJAT-50079]